MQNHNYTVDDWHGCFSSNWVGVVVDDAFDHPAKFARGLISRIYNHASECGWINKFSLVLDPFGGVAMGAIDAMRLGATWVGCELEPKFHKIGNENIALWNNNYGAANGWGCASLLLGDSRYLSSIVGSATVVISSPPYTNIGIKGRTNFNKPAWIKAGRPKVNLNNFDGVDGGYGTTDVQLGLMKEGNFNLVVSSPPYEGTHVIAIPGGGIGNKANPKARDGTGWWKERGDYGKTPGQMGYTRGDMFWEASRTILEELFKIVVPGGHAIFNTKAFVRKKMRVDFPGQWKQLCESVGFRLLHEHHAIIDEVHGTQLDLHGKEITLKTQRKSFFRNIQEAKGSPRIDYEIVHCFERPSVIAERLEPPALSLDD